MKVRFKTKTENSENKKKKYDANVFHKIIIYYKLIAN